MFSLQREKLEPSWSEDGSRVYFKRWSSYEPLPQLSGAPWNAPLVTWNLPLLGVLARVHAAAGEAWLPLLDVVASAVER